MNTASVEYIGSLRAECTHLSSGVSLITDAPVDNKGRGESFSPTDLTATSLAACIITTMGIAAEGRGFKIETMYAEVLKVMAPNPRRISEIVVDLVIKGELDAEAKSKLEDIGRNCPVAKSLHPDLIQNLTFTFE